MDIENLLAIEEILGGRAVAARVVETAEDVFDSVVALDCEAEDEPALAVVDDPEDVALVDEDVVEDELDELEEATTVDSIVN